MIVRGAVLREMGLPAPYADSRPLQVEELELAPPGPGELLIRIRATGLCHSDLSVIDGSRPRVMPMLLGHEATGEVIHSEAPGFAPGDVVACAFVPACGTCTPCAEGRAALCEPGAAANTAGTLLSGAHRLEGVHHHLGVSGFADHAVISAHSAVKINASLPPEIAALFGCAVMTGVGAVVNTAQLRAGRSTAIFGLGGVGLSALLGAVLAGAYPIVAVDVVPAKLDLARELGATATVNARDEDAVEQVRAATAGGAEYTFETVGNANVLAQAYAATRRGGTTITVGLPHPSQSFSVPAVSLVAEERTVKGSYLGSSVPSRDIPRYVALYQAGRLPVDRLLTATIGLDDLNRAFDDLAAGTSIRQVLLF
ncbi:zinc-dependent alcohol dehydrogenase family protein [Kribbella jejuensis]|uniref:Alcohol dehydrogenase n=1 Tax=Kribbella jejuensis TaxID=236068 RepID=A0A542EU78_9ACTN|nr:zinc-dependent alcohol dehydrogenase family protein [Kribbella jejuensis]TQJ18922.1 alcohol dehydrogenase [Kribbella jejuensis]